MIKILLLDDHAAVRAGCRLWLDGEPGLLVMAEAASTAQACDCVRRLALDVAIVDLELPGDSGLDAISRIKRRCPHIGVLVYTMHDNEAWALQAVQAGATGYLSKSGTPQALTAAVREVAAGRRVLPAGLAAAGQVASPQRPPNPLIQLTPREFEVLRLAVDGLAHADVARALHLSEKTIVNTLSRVRQKLGSPTDFGLMRLLAGQGLMRR